MSKPRNPVDLLVGELAKFPSIDRNAALAVSRQEGLSGGIGDNGTSFGPFQLHVGGALPASVWARGGDYAHRWAWSPAGIDYALSHIQRVAGGKRGAAAVNAIVSQFERPADPAGEIQRALAAYGGPAPAGAAAAAPSAGTSRARSAGAAALDPLLLTLFANNLQTLGAPSSITPLLALALGGGTPTTDAPVATAPASAAAAGGGASSTRFVSVPAAIAARTGIMLDPAVFPSAADIARQFGVRINSGYRDPAHNKSIGGASNSDHLRGDAVDFIGAPQQLAALYKYAQGRYPYVEPMAQAKDHVHISFRRP